MGVGGSGIRRAGKGWAVENFLLLRKAGRTAYLLRVVKRLIRGGKEHRMNAFVGDDFCALTDTRYKAGHVRDSETDAVEVALAWKAGEISRKSGRIPLRSCIGLLRVVLLARAIPIEVDADHVGEAAGESGDSAGFARGD